MSCDEQLTMGTAPISPVESLQGCVLFQAAHARLLVSRSHERNLHGTSNAHAHLRRLHMPLMPGSSTSACSTTPMPLRTMRRLPSTPAPEQVTTGESEKGSGRW